MLGRKGKCPKCGHRFVLLEPDEVELELAEPPATPLKTGPAVMTGTSAMWVPDATPVAEPELPRFPLASESPRERPSEKAGSRPGDDGSSRGPAAEKTPASTAAASIPVPGSIGIPDFTAVAATSEGSPSTSAIRKRRRRRNPSTTMVIAICSAVVAGTIGGVVLLRDPINVADDNRKPAPTINQAWQEEKAIIASSNDAAVALSPTDGEPITLNYVPFTPSLILHLRPSEIWGRDNQMREFKATLGDLGIWLERKIVEVTTFEPAEIEEITFAVVFGPRTSAPEVYTVFRLNEDQAPDVYRRFRGKLRKDLDEEVYEGDNFSYLMIDRRTFSVAPATVSDALAAAKKYPALAPPELDPLLKESDRLRHITLMFDVKTIDVHREFVLMEQLQTLADQFVVWMGTDVNTVSWSLHLQSNLYMETLLHQTNESSPTRVQRSIQSQLARLPDDVMNGVRIMRPQTEGIRQIIGRFPAMLKALQLGTSFHSSGQHARMVTLLPAKAAANLAAGALLTWNQSQLTDMSQLTKSDAPKGPRIPDKIADRLKLPVLVDFRNFPLQEAVAFIGDEIKTEFVIDGDALKGAGFTQNMSQTYDLGTVPALTAIDTILAKYAAERDPMVISVDEAAKRITLTTRSKAEADGIAIFPTRP